MQTVTLNIQDEYIDTILTFLKSLPNGSVMVETKKEKEKKILKKELLNAFEDIKSGRVYERI